LGIQGQTASDKVKRSVHSWATSGTGELGERQGSGPSAAVFRLASHTMAPRPSPGLRPGLSCSRLGQAGQVEQSCLGPSGRCSPNAGRSKRTRPNRCTQLTNGDSSSQKGAAYEPDCWAATDAHPPTMGLLSPG